MAVEDKHNKNKFTVNILGEELVIIGNVSEAYINKLTDYINEITEDITEAYPHLSRQRKFSLAIMNITDDFFKLNQAYKENLKIYNKLEEENKSLQEKVKKLSEEYEELLTLLEESD